MPCPWLDEQNAANVLKHGGVVAIPTETVYGLAGNAFDSKALAKIFEAKNRPTFDPLILHIASVGDLSLLAKNVPEKAKKLAEKFWPGPLTMVLPKKEEVPDLATSGLLTVAVRFPLHKKAQEIIKLAGVPLAAPSANLFKHISPTTANHVYEQLKDRIDGIVDGGACSVGVESTIVSFANETPELLRPGAITLEMLESVIGKVIYKKSTSAPGKAALAPGMLDTHYKPNVPLFYGVLPEGIKLPERTVRIAFGNQKNQIPETLNLSRTGNFVEATANLYAYMHLLDLPENKLILVDPIPKTGLGLALNDRLSRASLKDFSALNS